MKHVEILRVLLFSFAVFASLPLVSSETKPSNLRQGKFHTEEEGRKELASFAESTPNLKAWEERARLVRQGIIDGSGIKAALATKPTLNLIRHSRRKHDGYTVENVAFESLPGYFATGNLYRPANTGPGEKHPAVLCLHGHFRPVDRGGRFRPDMQIRCATLARAGAVVLALDAVGWGESTQYPHEERALSLQLVNGVRAIDFLTSFDKIDPERIGITGASGGGTQSFLLTAIEPRIAVSVPTVMVSAHFFGGCDCESGLPIHIRGTHVTNNAEIAALAAPRPQLLISCGADWTKNTPYVEYPFLKRVYGFYNAKSQVKNLHLAGEQHDYGPSKRQGAYQFFAEHLDLKMELPADESPVTIEPPEALLVFNDEHPLPNHALSDTTAIEKLLDGEK